MNAHAPHTTIGHLSLYADDPQQAAAILAELLGGRAAPFPPHAGGWVCFLAAERADCLLYTSRCV